MCQQSGSGNICNLSLRKSRAGLERWLCPNAPHLLVVPIHGFRRQLQVKFVQKSGQNTSHLVQSHVLTNAGSRTCSKGHPSDVVVVLVVLGELGLLRQPSLGDELGRGFPVQWRVERRPAGNSNLGLLFLVSEDSSLRSNGLSTNLSGQPLFTDPVSARRDLALTPQANLTTLGRLCHSGCLSVLVPITNLQELEHHLLRMPSSITAFR